MGSDARLDKLHFLHRQIREVKKGGRSVLLRKFLRVPLLALAIPIVLILRALRPLVLVRFGQLNSLPIGMFAAATEMYLCQRDADPPSNRTMDILHCGDRISNQQLKRMWQRNLHISVWGRLLFDANNHLPGGVPHVIRLPNDRDPQGLIPRSKSHLCFTAEEEGLGQVGLQALGIPEGAPFICFYARDTGYKGRDTGNLWSSLLNQDEKLHSYRNTSIQNYVLTAEELVRQGYFVIRMGAVVNEPLRITNPMIIDYATTSRSDFMDIFLCAKCSFFLGSTGGLTAVPRIFRRPVIFDNLVPLCPLQMLSIPAGSLFIPKKLWLREHHRFMTFREFLQTWSEEFNGDKHFELIGVDVIENSPEEILAATMEMEARLKGTWSTTERNEELQQRFWSLIEATEANLEYRPRMGAKFLSQNQKLLD